MLKEDLKLKLLELALQNHHENDVSLNKGKASTIIQTANEFLAFVEGTHDVARD